MGEFSKSLSIIKPRAKFLTDSPCRTTLQLHARSLWSVDMSSPKFPSFLCHLRTSLFQSSKPLPTSNVPLLRGSSRIDLGKLHGHPHCSPPQTVVLEPGVDQGVKVEYERPTVKHRIHVTVLMEKVGAFNLTIRITNSKSSTVSLVVLDQVPVPEVERLRVNIIVPRGLKDVDDVIKSGVGVDVNEDSHQGNEDADVYCCSRTAQQAGQYLRDCKNKTFSLRRLEDVIGSPSISGPKSPEAHPLAPAHSEAKSGSGWGTAKAVLKKNGKVRRDVNLYKGECIGPALEYEHLTVC